MHLSIILKTVMKKTQEQNFLHSQNNLNIEIK